MRASYFYAFLGFPAGAKKAMYERSYVHVKVEAPPKGLI